MAKSLGQQMRDEEKRVRETSMRDGDECCETECERSVHKRTHERNTQLNTRRHEDAPEVEFVCPIHGVVDQR